MTKKEIIKKTIDLIKCDDARISSPTGTHFMIIMFNKNTKDDPSYRRTTCADFNYTKQRVIAHGATYKSLWESIKDYHELSQMDWKDYIDKKFSLFNSTITKRQQ